MNLLEFYHQRKFAEIFNQPNVKGVVTVDGFSFDIRLINGLLYCNSLPIENFLEEGMLSVDEKILYEQAIYNWLLKYQAA